MTWRAAWQFTDYGIHANFEVRGCTHRESNLFASVHHHNLVTTPPLGREEFLHDDDCLVPDKVHVALANVLNLAKGLRNL
jgi:hypothetical protein